MATYDEVMTALRNADAAGATEDAAQLARIASSMRSQAPARQGSVTVTGAPMTQEPVTRTEQMIGLGSPVARTLKGAIVDPLLGINQALAQTGLFGEDIKRGATQNIQQYEQATKQARERVGSEGFDWLQLFGAVTSPINKILPAAAPTALGRMTQSSGTGLLMAGTQPLADTENYVMDKIKQLGFGAVVGALVSGGVEASSKVASVVKELAQPLTESGRTEALRKYVKGLVTGDKKDEIINALRTAPEIVPGSRPTAAEALADIPEAASLAAYQKNLSKDTALGISNRFSARQDAQEAARMAALGEIAQTPQALAAARQARTDLTAPMRQDVLEQANIAGQVVPRLEDEIASAFSQKAQTMQIGGKLGTEASQQARSLTGAAQPVSELQKKIALAKGQTVPDNFTQGNAFFPVSGMPRVPGSYRPAEDFAQVEANLAGVREAGDVAAIKQANIDFKRAQIDSVAQNGFYKLETAPIIQRIDTILSTAGMKTSDVIKTSMSDIRTKLTDVTNPNGVIDSRDLYAIRKDVGSIISNRAKEFGTWDEKLVGDLDKNVKSYIDNAIIKASEGTTKQTKGAPISLWENYLKTYQSASDKINRMEIGQALEQKLQTALGNKETAGSFATATQDIAQTIKSSTGSSRYTKLEDILIPKEVNNVNLVIQDLSRKAKAEELALRSRGGRDIETAELPNFLNRYASLTNVVLRALKQDANQKINSLAADLTMNPEKLAAFIENIPVKSQGPVLKALLSKLTPEMRTMFVNQLTVQKENVAELGQMARQADVGVRGTTFGVIDARSQGQDVSAEETTMTAPTQPQSRNLPSTGVRGDLSGSFNDLSPVQQNNLLKAQFQSEGNQKGNLARELNNPGAMVYVGGWQKQFGATPGKKVKGPDGKTRVFAEFPNLQSGVEAQRYLWSNTYGDVPLSRALTKWVDPSNDKEFDNYKASILAAIQ